MENLKILYYAYPDIPEYVRIISESIGIDTTIVPSLHLHEMNPAFSYFDGLILFAHDPQIDHVYIKTSGLWEKDNARKLVDYSGAQILDLSDDNTCLKELRFWKNDSLEANLLQQEITSRTAEEDEWVEPTYYQPSDMPNSVRIVSKELGIDTTFFPSLYPCKSQNSYYADLAKFAKNPLIDHVYADCERLFCDDDSGKEFYELNRRTVDICNGYFFSTEEHEKGLNAIRKALECYRKRHEQPLSAEDPLTPRLSLDQLSTES